MIDLLSIEAILTTMPLAVNIKKAEEDDPHEFMVGAHMQKLIDHDLAEPGKYAHKLFGYRLTAEGMRLRARLGGA